MLASCLLEWKMNWNFFDFWSKKSEIDLREKFFETNFFSKILIKKEFLFSVTIPEEIDFTVFGLHRDQPIVWELIYTNLLGNSLKNALIFIQKSLNPDDVGI